MQKKDTVGKQKRIKKKWQNTVNQNNDELSLQTILELGGNEDDYHLLKDIDKKFQNSNKLDSGGTVKKEELEGFINQLGFGKPANFEKKQVKTKSQKKKKDLNRKDDHIKANDLFICANQESLKLSPLKNNKINAAVSKNFNHISIPEAPLIMISTPWYSVLAKDTPSNIDEKFEHVGILKEYATSLLNNEIELFKKSGNVGQGSTKWIQSTAMSGTMADRVTALTYMFQQSPVHNIDCFETLVNISFKKEKREALKGIEAVRELLIHTEILPSTRKLRTFSQHPLLEIYLSLEAENECADWSPEFCQQRLIMWIFEDRFKQLISKFIDSIQLLSQYPKNALKLRAVGISFQLLKSKPEQEKKLLELIVNKIGDPINKISSKSVTFLQRLITQHPLMQNVVIKAVRDFLLTPNIGKRSQYYCVCFLTSQILSKERSDVAKTLIEIYMNFFKSLLASNDEQNKMLYALLTGVKRAFPYACMDDKSISEDIDELFKAGHHANLGTAVQALSILSQVYQPPREVPDRYYNALYSLLFHDALPRMHSRHTMFLNLLFRSLKTDSSERRVAAFLKRVLQICSIHGPAFIAALLTMIAELVRAKPAISKRIIQTNRSDTIKKMILDDDDDDDGEEHFVDAPTNGTKKRTVISSTKTSTSWMHKKVEKQGKDREVYDPFSRSPLYCGVEHASVWEMHALTRHYHPSVALYAQALLTPGGNDEAFHGDPLMDFTLAKFLDRFVYRNPKNKKTKAAEEADVIRYYQVHSRDRFIKPHLLEPVNTPQFRNKNAYQPEELFFQKYFSLPSVQKRLDRKKNSKKESKEAPEEVSDDEFESILDSAESHKDIRFSDHIGSSRKKPQSDSLDSDEVSDDSDENEEIDVDEESEEDTGEDAGFFIGCGTSMKRKATADKSTRIKRFKKAEDKLDRLLSNTAELDATMSSSIMYKCKVSAKQVKWEKKQELKDILEKKRERKKIIQNEKGRKWKNNRKSKTFSNNEKKFSKKRKMK